MYFFLNSFVAKNLSVKYFKDPFKYLDFADAWEIRQYFHG